MFRFQSSAPKAPQHSQYSWVKSMRFCRSMSSRYARMLLLMNRLSWSLIQSLKTNARTPVVNSRKKMIPRNTEKNLSRNVFSRSAPMHPAKPRMNITPPTTMKSQTGSRPPRSVIDEMFDRTPFSLHAHSPIPTKAMPSSQNRMLNPKIKYLMQQLTSWPL